VLGRLVRVPLTSVPRLNSSGVVFIVWFD